MDFRKKSAIVLFGVMTLGLSAHMMASAVSEIGDAGNKTLQIVKDSDAKSNSHLFLDLKNKNESSFLYTDNTNKNTDSHANKTNDDFFYIDGMPKNKVKSGLRKNTKAALGVLSSSAIAAGTGYAVKKFVANKWTSEEVNQSLVGKEKQSNDYKGTSEKVNQILGKKEKQNSDNKGSSEKVDQSVGEKEKQNSDYKGTSEKVDQSVGEKEKQNSDHKDTSEKVNQILGKKEKQNSDNKGSSEKVKQSLGKQEKKYNNEKKEENLGNNSQGSGTSGNNGNDETGSQSQTPENQGSNSGNGVNLKVIVPIVVGVALLIVVATVVTLVVSKFKSNKILTNEDVDTGVDNYDNNKSDSPYIETVKNLEVVNNNNNSIGNENSVQKIVINDNPGKVSDEDEEVLSYEQQIENIKLNLGFDENLARSFYNLLLAEDFEGAAKAAFNFFENKLTRISMFKSDPGFDYGGIIDKVNICIDAIKRAYKQSDTCAKNGGVELGDNDQIFDRLKKIINKCNKEGLELKNGSMGNFKFNYESN